MNSIRLVFASAALVALAACAVAPTEPAVMALPGRDKTLDQFKEDDAACRRYAVQPDAAARQDASWDQQQRRYDVAYIQCMYSKGHKVPVAGAFTSKPPGAPPPPPPAQAK